MGDKRSRFEAQVMPHLDAAYRFARWLARSPGDADDLVQEAMLRAFRGFDALRGTEVKAWLLAIIRNCHLTARQQQQRRGRVPLPDEHDEQDGHAMVTQEPGPEAAALRRDEQRLFVQLLAELTDEHREILVLREIEEMDYREMATVMNVPMGTVMSRLARARAALKARWLQHAEGAPRAMR